MKLAHLLAIVALPLLGASCASSQDGPREAGADLEALEARLLEAPLVHSTSHLVAEGAFAAELRCVHTIDRNGQVFVKAQGTLGGQPVDLTFVAEHGRMSVTAAQGQRELAEPSDLRGGLLLGLTRMGWLHNVAMLAGGGWPDATDGSADEFARALDVMSGEELEVEGRIQRALTFGIEVRGQIAGSAVLLLDCETGLPIERWQKVQMPGGEMHVVETYETFTLDLGAPRAAGYVEG
jgi:hypothetical protein